MQSQDFPNIPITPLVTIQCITYNHESYIRQCLEGFIMQKTTFPFEAIVHDDASTDGTAAIIREYSEKYPDIIKPIYETENQYSKRDGSLTRIMNAHTRGKYVAICEGDDYWIDPLKLQKQVDFLEEHSEYGLVYTNCKIFYDHRKQLIPAPNSQRSSGHIFEELLLRNFIVTATVLVRSNIYFSAFQHIQEYAQFWIMGDYPLWLEIAKDWNIKYFPNYTAVYRIRTESASHSSNINTIIAFNKSVLEIQRFFAVKTQKQNLLSMIEEGYYAEMYLTCLEYRYKEVEYYRKKMRDYIGTTKRNKILRFSANHYMVEITLRFLLNNVWARKLYSHFTS